ncbi:MAG TPA: tetratricopeptide repeat protein [Allosphingosinicella sp.]|nr:tetratricopeptide repeat protein [Allosphingosinicella sp.]
MGRTERLTLLTAALLAGSTALVANPGGGSGGSSGSSTPSMSAPDYDPAAEYRKGVEALQAQRYEEAGKAFGKVLKVAPADANTNYLAGLAAAGLGDLKASRKYYERALRADKEMIPVRRELGLTYAKLGEKEKADAQLAALKAMQDKCAGACAKAAEIGTAIQTLTAALGAPPQARLESRPSLLFASAAAGDRAYLDAVALINEGRYQAAIEALDFARATFGPHPDVLTYLGFANRKLGRHGAAEAYYRAALAAAPGHRGATEYYGELMVERGDLEAAGRMLAKLEDGCDFGCAEADELRRWIQAARSRDS